MTAAVAGGAARAWTLRTQPPQGLPPTSKPETRHRWFTFAGAFG